MSVEAEQDEALPSKLEAELPGIFNWAVEGWRQCQEKGLEIPASVQRNVETLRSVSVNDFTAFCEDRGLLPVEMLRKAYEHRDPFNPRPIWEN